MSDVAPASGPADRFPLPPYDSERATTVAEVTAPGLLLLDDGGYLALDDGGRLIIESGGISYRPVQYRPGVESYGG